MKNRWGFINKNRRNEIDLFSETELEKEVKDTEEQDQLLKKQKSYYEIYKIVDLCKKLYPFSISTNKENRNYTFTYKYNIKSKSIYIHYTKPGLQIYSDDLINLFIGIIYYNLEYEIIQKISGSETEYNITMISYPVFIIEDYLFNKDNYKKSLFLGKIQKMIKLLFKNSSIVSSGGNPWSVLDEGDENESGENEGGENKGDKNKSDKNKSDKNEDIHQDFLRIMREIIKNIVSHAFLEYNTLHTKSMLHHIDNIRYSGYPILLVKDILEVEKKEDIWEMWEKEKKGISIIDQKYINKAFDRWRKEKTIEKTDWTQWIGQFDHEYYTKDCFIFFYLQRIRELYNFCYDKDGNLTIEDDNFYYIYTLLNEINFEENKELFPEIDDINNFENIIEKLEEKSEDIQKKYTSIMNVFQDLIVLYQIYRDEDYWKNGDDGEFVKRDFVIGYHKLDIREKIQEIIQLLPKKDKNKGDENKGDKNKGDKNKGDKNKGDKNKGDKNKGDEKKEYSDIFICPTTLDIEKIKGILDNLDKFPIIKDLYDELPEKPEKENISFFAINLIFEYFIDRIANITQISYCSYKKTKIFNKCIQTSENCKKTNDKSIFSFIYPNNVEKIKKEKNKILVYGFSSDISLYKNCKKYFNIFKGYYKWNILYNKYATATAIKNREIPFPLMFILPKGESVFPKYPLKEKYNTIFNKDKSLYSITLISYLDENYNHKFKELFFIKYKKRIKVNWFDTYLSYFNIINNKRQIIEKGSFFEKKNITYDEFNSLVRYYKCNVFLYIGEEDIQDNHILCMTLYNKKELFTYFYEKKLYSIFEEFSEDFDKMFIKVPYTITEPKPIYVSDLPGIRNKIFTQSIELQNENFKNFLEGKISRIKFLELEQLTREQQLQVQTGGNKKQIQLFQDTFTLFHKSNLLKRNNNFFDYMNTYYKFDNIFLYSTYFSKYNYITEKFFRINNMDITLKKKILQYTINNPIIYFTTELCHTFPFINSSTKNILELSSQVQPSFLHTILHKYPDKNFHLQQYFMPKYTYSDNFLKQIEILQTLEKATGYNITTMNSYITKEFITSKSTKQDIIYNDLSNNPTNLTTRLIENMNTQLQFSIFLFALHHLQLGGHYIYYVKIAQTKATADLCLLGKSCFEKVHLYRIKCQNIFKQSGVYIIFYNYQGMSNSRKKELLDIFDTLYTYDPTGGEIYNLHEEKYRSTGDEKKNVEEETYKVKKPLIPGFTYKYIYEFLPIPEDSKEYDFIREFNDIWFTKRIRHYKMLIDIKKSPEKVQEFLKDKFKTAQVVSSILWAKEFGMKLDTDVDLVNDFHKYLQEDFHSNQEILLEWKKPTSTKYISPDPNVIEAYTSTMIQQKEYYDMLIEKNTTIDDTDKEIQNIFFQYDLDTNQTFIEKTKKVLENVQKTLGTIKPKGNMIIQIPLPWIQFPEIQLVYELITSFKHVYFIKPSRYGYGTNFYIVCKNFKKYTKTTEKKTIFPIDFIETYLEHIGILIWNIFYYTHRHQYYQEDSKYISL